MHKSEKQAIFIIATQVTVIEITIKMKFYNRESEVALLNKIEKKSHSSAQMTFIVGRRRIGKTSLLVKAFEQKTHLYVLS